MERQQTGHKQLGLINKTERLGEKRFRKTLLSSNQDRANMDPFREHKSMFEA